jgi:hypothetical protein
MMNLLRRVPAPQVGDVLCFTVGLVFNGVLAEAEEVIRHRNVVEQMVATEIDSRSRREGLTGDLGDGALSYIVGAAQAADGLTTVDVSIWSRKTLRSVSQKISPAASGRPLP